MQDPASSVKDRSLLRLQLDARHDAFLTEPWIQVTSNGKHIFCQSGDKVNVLSCESGQVLYCLESKEDPIYTVALSPDEKVLITSHTSGLLRQWDWKAAEVIRTWKALHTGPIPTLAFDATSTLVASGGVDGTIKVWDIVRQYCTHSLKGSVGVISTLKFYQNEQDIHVYSSSDDSVIRCWNLASSEIVQELKGHFSKITSLLVDKAQKQLVSCSRDKVLMVWNIADGSLIRTVATHEVMEGAALVQGGGLIAGKECRSSTYAVTVGERGILRVWNMATSECIYEQDDQAGSACGIRQICYIPSSKLMTVVNYEHNILVYALSTMKLKHQYVGFSDEILDIVFCGKNESHIAVATNSPIIKLYDMADFNCQLVKGHTDTVLALSVSPTDKNMFASSSKDDTVRLWRLDDEHTVACLALGSGHTASVTSICWSQLTSRFIVTGAEDKCIKMWRIPTLEKKVPSSPASLHCQLTEIAHEKDINSVAVSPNDRLIASASQDKMARLFSVDGLKLLGVLRGHRRGIWAVAFSPVDQIVATASADCTVRLWSITDFSCVKTFEGHDSSVLRVLFLCRGMQLMTCSADGLLKLWSVKGNECVQSCSEHEAKVWALAAASDEKRFVSGGADSTLLVWRDVHEEEVAANTEAAALRATQEQTLANLVQQKQWLRALKLAIKLKRPFRCLQILKEVRREPEHEAQLSEILTRLRDDQVDELLQFVVEWNTNSKHCHEAQLVVSLLLRLRPPDAWRSLPSFRTLLEGLLPYTERHLERMGRLLQSITFLDYTAACMKVTSRPGAETLPEAYADEDLFAMAPPKPDAAEVDTEKIDGQDSIGVGGEKDGSEDSGLETESAIKVVRNGKSKPRKRLVTEKKSTTKSAKKKRRVSAS